MNHKVSNKYTIAHFYSVHSESSAIVNPTWKFSILSSSSLQLLALNTARRMRTISKITWEVSREQALAPLIGVLIKCSPSMEKSSVFYSTMMIVLKTGWKVVSVKSFKYITINNGVLQNLWFLGNVLRVKTDGSILTNDDETLLSGGNMEIDPDIFDLIFPGFEQKRKIIQNPEVRYINTVISRTSYYYVYWSYSGWTIDWANRVRPRPREKDQFWQPRGPFLLHRYSALPGTNDLLRSSSAVCTQLN